MGKKLARICVEVFKQEKSLSLLKMFGVTTVSTDFNKTVMVDHRVIKKYYTWKGYLMMRKLQVYLN